LYANKRNFNINSGGLLTAISPKFFYQYLEKNGIEFFTGIPDSLLKEFCLCLNEHVPKDNHIIAANEGNAIALASGYHLAKEKIPLVYMQNSGIGNAVNPLLSLCDPQVYSIPLILLIGWRGQPGVSDEPQHLKQGEIQLDLLKTMDIPYVIISKNDQTLINKINQIVLKAKNENRPCAIIVEKNTFEKYKPQKFTLDQDLYSREESLKIVLNMLPKNSVLISTTGKTSREIFEIREQNSENHSKDFLTVGSMGHCSSIALGIAINKPQKKIFCIDGDGSLIMHMGSLSTIGHLKPKNYYHILINNFVHESVGGQQTSARFINMVELAKSNGYRDCNSTKKNIRNKFYNLINSEGPSFLEIIVNPGSRANLGRPTITPLENKQKFIENLKN